MPRSISRVVLLCGLLALAAAAGGCQREQKWKLSPVEGTVAKNGRPLANIEVVFLADAGTQGPRASGTTDEAGHYRLRTDNGDDGAAVGKYRVILRDPNAARRQLLRGARREHLKDAAEASPENAQRLEEEQRKSADGRRVPPNYESFPKTPLRAEVGSGPLVFDIEMP